MIVLLVLTPVFKNMPQNAQGAIIIVAVYGLINYGEFFYLWKVSTMSCSLQSSQLNKVWGGDEPSGIGQVVDVLS